MPVENFAAVVKRLAKEKGISVNQVGFTAYNPGVRGTNPDTFKSVMAGRRKPTLVLMQAVADVLTVEPTVFYEWLIENARERLDEASAGEGPTADELRAATEALGQALLEAAAAMSQESASPPARARGKGRLSQAGEGDGA